jgi:membrane associated rhomboid family serine protease
MFIPIGLEENEVRRVPWVTWGLIAVNVLVFLMLFLAEQQSGLPQRIEKQGEAIQTYLSEHPYLEVPAELDARLSDDDRRQLERERKKIASARRTPADWEIARQQKTLDDMVDELFAAFRASPIARWGFIPGKPDALRLFTMMFVHAGWIHLLGNMFFLFGTGPFIEDAYGRVLYPILYLLSGLAATGVHAVHNPGSLEPTVGASGAIAGIMGAFLVRYAKQRMVFLWLPFFPIPFLVRRIRVPAFLYLPFWFLGQVLLSSASGEETGVAVWAHIGGFLFGFIAALLIAALGIERKFIEPAIQRQVGGPENVGLLRAMEAGARGDLVEARRATGHVLAEDPGNIDASRYAFQVALDSQDPARIGVQATRLLDLYAQHGEKELALDLIREVQQAAPSTLPPRFLLRAGDFLARLGDRSEALAMYERILRSHPSDGTALRALLQSADLRLNAGDSSGAAEDLRRAQDHPAYGPEWKELVEAKLSDLQRARLAAAREGYRGPTRR